jgi:hypothetical protein
MRGMVRRLLALLTCLLCFHTASFANGLPDYIRYAKDDKSERL